ncbi:Glycosidase [Rubrobacter radiotolerans]|uniref:Alpha-amylase family glycosyl hydrolase n=1 Tax=Rubrobacter radiotolerans TaxID=42256 RepID=A0A023WZV4_RUBRA|nr:alpha-amylase family glycosyl hydrolase [Rubrobacter radiotolerans]AHY45481.1 Glycosidase [Rubrobacter radiotolerans]MDX5892892.1 alpha-amylase family glycosyl hydrolase [Rubrobacter radiotolerans]SMC02697.1 alpha-glucosidase [Rubrobacter radiotolerans DSM 5868]
MSCSWWQGAVVYQVYPRSFCDASGDGVGDLQGIKSKLGYLAWLGVDAVWLSPVFPSPMVDFGYDVSDYKDVHPMFGTLQDFDALVAEAHRLGLKVILDYVPNHSSDEHPWFVEARSSRKSPKRDFYVWRDPKPEGKLPNNWLSEFGGPAWTFEECTGQFYYHAYHPRQPDLNWRNEELVREMLDVLRFWMERGVDGFRVDAIRHLVEDENFRDNLPNPDWREGDSPYEAQLAVNTTSRPETYRAVGKMRQTVDEFGERTGKELALIGEVYLPVAQLVSYYGGAEHGPLFDAPTNMHFTRLDAGSWNARDLAAHVEEYEAALPAGAWPNWVLGNHDRPRVASRLGAERARVAAMLLLTLRGTPTIYYGDELGMTDGEIPPGAERDPVAKSAPGYGRDPVRTPMHWDGTPSAGFTTGEPWLPVAGNHREVNVEAERKDPRSSLSLYRRLLALRRSEPALSVGSYRTVSADGDVFAYAREGKRESLLVVLNLGSEPASLPLSGPGRILLSTRLDREGEKVEGELPLRPDEGLVLRVLQR